MGVGGTIFREAKNANEETDPICFNVTNTSLTNDDLLLCQRSWNHFLNQPLFLNPNKHESEIEGGRSGDPNHRPVRNAELQQRISKTIISLFARLFIDAECSISLPPLLNIRSFMISMIKIIELTFEQEKNEWDYYLENVINEVRYIAEITGATYQHYSYFQHVHHHLMSQYLPADKYNQIVQNSWKRLFSSILKVINSVTPLPKLNHSTVVDLFPGSGERLYATLSNAVNLNEES